MNYYKAYPDAGTMRGWYDRYSPLDAIELPRIPLLLASLKEDQLNGKKMALEKNGWKRVCWYPSCHGDLAGFNSYKVFLYAKEDKDAPLDMTCAFEKYPSFKKYPSFNLGCSVWEVNKFIEKGPMLYHRALSIRRISIKGHPILTRMKEKGNWWKFATTPLATYWCWGLKPEDTNPYRLEPHLKPKKVAAK